MSASDARFLTEPDESTLAAPTDSASRSSRAEALTIAIAIAIAILLPARELFHAPGPAMEEGFMLAFPDRVLHGAIANKDFLYLYGPGSLWFLAAVYKVFGTHIEVERVVGLLQLVAFATGAALLVRYWGRWMSVTAIALSAMVVVPALQFLAIPWTGGAALGVFAIVALLDARATHRSSRAALGGVLAGLAVLWRVDLVVAVILGGGAAMSGLDRALVKRAVYGFLGGLSPYLLHVALAGPTNVWRGMIVDPVFHMRSSRRLPVPPDPNHLSGVARVITGVDRWWPLPRLAPSQQLFAWFLLLAWLSVGLVIVGALCVFRDRAALRPRVLLAGALFGLGVFPQAVQRADSAHFAWVSGIVFALVPAAITELLSQARPAWRLSRVGAIAGAGVILAVALLLPTYTARRYFAFVQGAFNPTPIITLHNEGRNFFIGDNPDEAHSVTNLLQTVDREVPRGSRIIVGNTDMRRVPYVDSYLYYLLPQLRPGTAFIEFEPGVTNRSGTRLTREMRRADAFIASDRWLAWNEPNDSMKPGDPGPALILQSDFCLRQDFGNGYKLFLRCRQ